MFSPEAFGLATLFASLTLIIGIVACLRYEWSIVLPSDEGDAANLLAVCLFSSIAMGLLTIPIVVVLGPLMVRWTGVHELAFYIWLLPLAVFMHGIHLSLNYWNTRRKNYATLSAVRVVNQSIVTSTNVSGGLVGVATGGIMIVATLAGRAVSITILAIKVWREHGRFLMQNVRYSKMLAGAKRYKKFPLYSTWSALLNAISWQLPTLMFGVFFSPAVVGYYALGVRILQMPMNLIGKAISQVFIQRAAVAKDEGKLPDLVKRLFERLVMVSLFPLLTLSIVGRDLYIVAFGENWSEAGIYAQILSVWAFFWFVSSPLSHLFTVLERQEVSLKIDSILLLTRLLSLGIGAYQQSVYLALFLYAGTGIMVYGLLTLKILQYSGVPIGKSANIIWRSLLGFLPFGIPLLIILVIGAPKLILLSATLIALATHGIIVFKRLR